MPTRKRLAIARLSHEGNSFTPVPTDLSAFRHREWTVKKEKEVFLNTDE